MHALSLRIAAVTVLMLAWALPCGAAEMGPQAVDAAWVKGMKANDLDAIMKCYAPDAVAWLPDMREARGATAIRAAYQEIMSANTVKDVALMDTKYKTTGTLAAGWGKFSLTLVSKADGKTTVMTGRFNEVAERRAGKWVYIVDHASAEPTGTESAKQ